MIKALGLNFDAKEELEKRQAEREKLQTEADCQYLDQIREETKT